MKRASDAPGRPSTASSRPGRKRRSALLGLAGAALAIAFSVTPALGQATGPVPLQIVILGDSFSAGNGAGDYYGPSTGDQACWRSDDTWGERYAELLPYDTIVVNRACSGAQTRHILTARTEVTDHTESVTGEFTSPFDPGLVEAIQAEGHCTTNYPEEEAYVVTPIRVTTGSGFTVVDYTCSWQLDRQADAVGKNTDLVLLTTGGNDVGFREIIEQCLLFAPGRSGDPVKCGAALDSAMAKAAEGGSYQTELEATLTGLRAQMRPEARIVLFPYPRLVADIPDFVFGGRVVNDEIRALGARGDAAQAAAIAAAGGGQVIHFSQLRSCFDGTAATPDEPTHEPFAPYGVVNDDRWIWELERGILSTVPPPLGEGGFGPQSYAGNIFENYHPSPDGHEGWAQCILDFAQPNETFGVSGSVGGGDVDLVFTIDTTGSMGDDIDAVKAFASELVDQLSTQTASFRFALTTYRDWPEHTGDFNDYPSRLELDFTDDRSAIVSAINDLEVDGGGDTPETVYSGMLGGIRLDWRTGVKKIVLQLGDAPPHDPEPVTGFTADTVVQAALAVDPAEVYVVNVSGGMADPLLTDIATRTGGEVFSAPTPSEVADAVAEAIDEALAEPFAWAGGPYVTTVGTPVVLDAEGSFDADGSIVSYEWDLDGDGDFDTSSSSRTYTHTFTAPFDGRVELRVTDDDGRSSISHAIAHASVDGDEIPAGADNCPTVSNRDQADSDADGLGDACDPTPDGGATSARTVIAAGAGHSLALLANGTMRAWGLGSSGQLGRGSKTLSTTPVAVTGLTDVTSIAAGEHFSLALRTDGTVWAWGSNKDGQLGDGTNTDRLSPIRVTGLPSIAAIAAGNNHSLALASNGTVWAWGDNSFGQVGDRTSVDRSRPVQVPGVSGITALAGGGYHTLALTSAGTVLGWGGNPNGQLGDGTRTTNQLTPVQVLGLTGVIAIDAGFQHSAAVSSGTVWTWGKNTYGQLGDGTTIERLAPVQVPGAGSTAAVAAGQHHTMALRTDGTVRSWGNNSQGQLGDGTTTRRLVPVTVTGLGGVTAISTSWQHSLAVRSDGTDRGWGYNKYGQLGDGSNTDRKAPVPVAGITTNAQP